MKEFIEIPFGAKDSELGGWEYNIPEGYTASIENGKIIVKKKESEDEKIRDEICTYIGAKQDISLDVHNRWIAWLEKQNAPNKVSIWKHWKDGIAGNGDGKQMFLIKSHNTYNLSSCLSFECDYIELSELEKLMEKKDESKFEQCIQEGDKIVTNEDGTHFNISQLERTANKVTESKKTAKEFLKSAEIMDENGKLADEYKLKPKFKDGDWVVCEITGSIYQIENCIENPNNHKCGYLINGGYISSSEVNHYHLWTIQDAKDGDVLFHSDSASNGIFIFKEIIDRGFAKEIICYCDYDSEDHFCLGEHHTCCWADAKILHPATKEQRALLFQKMKEAGYKWDTEKKELKKIHVIDEGKSEMDYCFTKMMNGEKINPAWSEEDERMCNASVRACQYMIENFENSTWDYEDAIDWLKSLKDRVQSQNNTITSDELAQAKKEAYNDALDKIEYHSGVPSFDDGWSAAIWYIKKKNIDFKNTWRPSKEQMKGIDCAIKTLRHQLNVEDKRLNSLYEQLKKL